MLTIDDVLRPQIINVEGRRYRKLPACITTNQHVEQPRETYAEEGKDFCDFDVTEAIPKCSSSGSFFPYVLHGSKLVQYG